MIYRQLVQKILAVAIAGELIGNTVISYGPLLHNAHERHNSSLSANTCILHTHSFLAARQVSHFEPAGINDIFIPSNPFAIMVGRQQV